MVKMLEKVTFASFVILYLVVMVLGHGRLINPASRNAAWRFFPNRPPQYTDNELNCGGFSVQWGKNKGKCGVCGDPYHEKNPRYVHPGKYADDVFITKTYKEGKEIVVTVDITSNHQGFFRFSVGKVVQRPITQEQLTHVLLQPSGQNTWPLHSSKNGKYDIKLVLPKGLTCDHCVMQWWWTVGNNWGCDENGNCGVGLGKKQETFVNCADIKIEPADEGAITGEPAAERPSVKPTNKSPNTERPTSQSPTSQGPPTDEPVTKPSPTETPQGPCKASAAWAGNANMDEWCRANCPNNCPSSHCTC